MKLRSKLRPKHTLPADFTLDTDKVIPVRVFAEQVLGVSTDTFQRICKAGDGPPITRLSANRIGIRGRDGKTWLESRRAKAGAAS
jgi:hypothetical protein